MKTGSMIRMLACGAMALAPAAATASTSFSALYVFGDSLVDGGNIAALTGGAVPDPGVGYFPGRFTNGLNYVDYISLAYRGDVTRPSLTGGNNFAFGGARIVSDLTDPIPDLAPQIGAYVATRGPAADPNALYILNAGGNDVFALGRFAGGAPGELAPFGNPTSYVNALLDTYAGAVLTLNSLGARNILVTGIPNATTPFALELDALLQARFDGLALAPGTNFLRFSYIDFFNRVATNPAALGLPPLDTDTSCIEAGAQASGCFGYFSFDGVHPTAAVQRAVFNDMVRQFGFADVPEPESWALMILGFGMAGAAIRRRPHVRVSFG